VTSIVTSASDLAIEIDGRAKAAAEATNYASKKLGVFPPPPGMLLQGKSDADWAVRITMMKAIGAYAKALAEANDPALSKSVSETAASLSVSLSNFETARLSSAGLTGAEAAARANRIQLVGGIVSDALGFATELYTGARIREVMTNAHPTLVSGVAILKKDLAELVVSIQLKRIREQRNLTNKLEVHVSDPLLNSVQRYELYMAAASELAALQARVEVLQQAGEALDNMLQAHESLIGSSDDKRALSAFLAIVQSMSDKVKKLRDLQKPT
jgi:hypothetical protein